VLYLNACTAIKKAFGVLGIFRVVSEFNVEYVMKIISGFYTKVLIMYFLCTRWFLCLSL
jgi:hypothetical protein